MNRLINIVKNTAIPTPNRVTDPFGVWRVWGGTGWNPNAKYSPIHWGTDFSGKGVDQIVAPVSGQAWGEKIPGAIGSCISVIPHLDGEPVRDIIMYLIHCEPTASRWSSCNARSSLTSHAGYGIGAPHLHWEVALTPRLARALQDVKLLQAHAIDRAWWKHKSDNAGLDHGDVDPCLRSQMASHGIVKVYNDAIVRDGLPAYKRSRFSDVGEGETWVVDIMQILGRV